MRYVFLKDLTVVSTLPWNVAFVVICYDYSPLVACCEADLIEIFHHRQSKSPVETQGIPTVPQAEFPLFVHPTENFFLDLQHG